MINDYVNDTEDCNACEQEARRVWGDALFEECQRHRDEIFGFDQFTTLEQLTIILRRAPELLDFNHLRPDRVLSWRCSTLFKMIVQTYNIPEDTAKKWLDDNVNRFRVCTYWRGDQLTFRSDVTTGSVEMTNYVIDMDHTPRVKLNMIDAS